MTNSPTPRAADDTAAPGYLPTDPMPWMITGRRNRDGGVVVA